MTIGFKKNNSTKDDQFDTADLIDSHITDTINSSNKYENREGKFEKALLAQLKYNADDLISKERMECIKRVEKLEGK